MTDPGFPVGGVDLVGGADSRGGYISKMVCVEMKESGSLRGGACTGHAPLDPPMHLYKYTHDCTRMPRAAAAAARICTLEH